jgi:hypothetical protein
MHTLHADVFGITPLKLNQHFAQDFNEPEMLQIDCADMPLQEPAQANSNKRELLTLPYQLNADLLLLRPQGFSEVWLGSEVDLQDNVLILPAISLSAADKRALWKLLYDK